MKEKFLEENVWQKSWGKSNLEKNFGKDDFWKKRFWQKNDFKKQFWHEKFWQKHLAKNILAKKFWQNFFLNL